MCGGPLTPVLGSAPWGFGSSRSRGVMVTFYARAAIRRYVVGTIRLKKMPPTWAARLEEATMVDEAQLSKAVAALTAGKSVVFPTDTVYGIGIAVGLACSPEAIFIDKRRDPDKSYSVACWLSCGAYALWPRRVAARARYGFAVLAWASYARGESGR